MTILRSRTVAGQAVALANAGVDRALKEWESRVAMAREAGRQQGLTEAASRVAEAERRAAKAEATAAERMAKQQAEFLARFEPILTSLSGASQQLNHLEKQLVQESEAEIVRLALAVAAAVLRCTVERDPAWMTALARHAISEVPDRRTLVVRMHPIDAASLNERVATVIARIPGLEHVEVVGDASLARGSCIVQSQGTRLDAGIPNCWDRLAQRLLDSAPSSDCAVVARPGDRSPSSADGVAP